MKTKFSSFQELKNKMPQAYKVLMDDLQGQGCTGLIENYQAFVYEFQRGGNSDVEESLMKLTMTCMCQQLNNNGQ